MSLPMICLAEKMGLGGEVCKPFKKPVSLVPFIDIILGNTSLFTVQERTVMDRNRQKESHDQNIQFGRII
jgi:hypothetical protein